MAFLKIENVRISGISACVPAQIEENSSCPLFTSNTEFKNFAATTGVERRRMAPPDICSSDLCIAAGEKLIADLNWNKEDISFLVFVSCIGDYIIPATSPNIQHRLGLGKDCYTLDISFGCSGWVYGMSVISALLANNASSSSTKALLMVGETHTKFYSIKDKSAYPLMGDAGAVTALEYHPGSKSLFFDMNSDGGGYKAIIMNDGGVRNPFSTTSLDIVDRGNGIFSNNLQIIMQGMDVFSFAIKEAPKSVNRLIETYNLDKEKIDYFILHQASFILDEQIRKRLKLPVEKVPYSLRNFGNTSSATIPLTMATQLKNDLETKSLSHIGCGFGVGLSWGSIYFTTDHIVCSSLVEI